MKLTNEKLAYETIEYRGIRVKAFWGDEPDARIEVWEGETMRKAFLFPAYKIFNISAHMREMVDEMLGDSNEE